MFRITKTQRKEMKREMLDAKNVKLQKKLMIQEKGMEKILTFLDRLEKIKERKEGEY